MARVLEKDGIATVTLSMFQEMAKHVNPPRTLLLKNEYGAPYGKPLEHEDQRKVLIKALEMAKIGGLKDESLLEKL
jgi:hypothetical protein